MLAGFPFSRAYFGRCAHATALGVQSHPKSPISEHRRFRRREGSPMRERNASHANREKRAKGMRLQLTARNAVTTCHPDGGASDVIPQGDHGFRWKRIINSERSFGNRRI